MSIDKNAEEWIVMRYFREKYADFPKGKLVKSESPDFILKVNRKKRIGIELTRFDYNSSGSNTKSLLNLIAKKEEKLRIYQKKLLSAYWLIISIETPEPKKLLSETSFFKSKFDKVFLFDLFSGQMKQW